MSLFTCSCKAQAQRYTKNYICNRTGDAVGENCAEGQLWPLSAASLACIGFRGGGVVLLAHSEEL